MHLVSAHCDPHRTLTLTSDGRYCCFDIEEFDHPVHHIEAVEPRPRQRHCERRIGDEVRISDKFCRDLRSSSVREQNHRQHSRRLERRAPKSRVLMALAA